MPGIINAHRALIRKNAKFIRLRHLENNRGSLFLSDLDTEENKLGNNKIPVYVPFGETIDILLTDRTLTSYQQGSIRGFIDSNFLEGWIVQNLEVEEGKGNPVPVYDVEIDEELVTVDTSAGDVLINLPEILGFPFPEERLPEGTRFVIKKITDDPGRVIITPAAGENIEGSPASYIIEDYLDLVILQSDDQGNWWVLGCGCNDDVDLDFFLLSHYNTQDGNNDATVAGPVFNNAFVSTPVANAYGTGGWDDGALHPVSNATLISYVNAEEATQLNTGTITATVNYFDDTNTLVSQTLTFTTDATERVESVPGLEVEISGLTLDLTSRAGFLETRITPLDLPGFASGGRIESFRTEHVVGSQTFFFENTDGVFIDPGPTPPQNEGNPIIALENLTTTDLSGVPYYTNGTQLRIEQGFLETFDQTYRSDPFVYQASDLAAGFGNGTLDLGDAEVTIPNALPEDDDRADINLLLTLSGSGTCSTGGDVRTRVRDPFGQSGFATAALSNTLFYNRNATASRNFEDFRREERRLQRDDDNTTPNDRDLGDWDSSQNILTYDDTFGLQVRPCSGGCDGFVAYPTSDYTGFAPSGPDYSGATGETYEGIANIRWYYRFFSNSSGTIEHSGGVVRLDLCSGTLSVEDLLNDRLIVEVMLANPSADPSLGGRSGFLSLNREFNNAIFDPNGATRAQRGCLTNTDELNNATSPPNFGFTLSSNAFPFFTSLGSNFGVRVRIGIRPDFPFEVSGLTLVGW
jgi:hypothetical protein